MSKGRRGSHEEEHENHERWLVTYADMVTLLMVLFIVMFAMSQVDEKKFNALKAGLAAGFGQSVSIQDGSDNILNETGLAVAMPIAPGQSSPGQRKQDAGLAAQLARYDELREQQVRKDAQVEAQRLSGLQRKVEAALAKRGLGSDVRATIDERGLVLSLVSRHVVFEPDVAELSARGREVLDQLAPVLADLTEPLSIEGHTNQEPVKPRYFATDWELSAARAVGVLRYLNEEEGIPNRRMTASAYGHEKPLIDPSKPDSQAVNKRVDIVIRSTQPAETRALLAGASRDQSPRGDGS
ncbi:chemotaxis protein MotB [Nocardioides scoriae]|uniref:Chemotaxis protein MotB n=1 Tax=Nocardioides scoriae TaxID=642780 RepID=A0A1H1S7P8_9ACTN|nr:flagellar motor protein MotB [Nocardioides scoriae]SDS43982.1 chemotaxis protein MotB [Nocardioides scoriae]